MKKPNLQRLAQRSKIYLRKASPTILSGLGAAGVIVTSVLAVRATPKALRKIRADSKTNHDGDPEAYNKLEAVKSAWACYIPAAISGTATIFCIFGANVLNKRQQAALTSAYALLNDSYNNYKDKSLTMVGSTTIRTKFHSNLTAFFHISLGMYSIMESLHIVEKKLEKADLPKVFLVCTET